jgi:hypothetical protein
MKIKDYIQLKRRLIIALLCALMLAIAVNASMNKFFDKRLISSVIKCSTSDFQIIDKKVNPKFIILFADTTVAWRIKSDYDFHNTLTQKSTDSWEINNTINLLKQYFPSATNIPDNGNLYIKDLDGASMYIVPALNSNEVYMVMFSF